MIISIQAILLIEKIYKIEIESNYESKNILKVESGKLLNAELTLFINIIHNLKLQKEK